MGHTANAEESSESKSDPASWPNSLEKLLIELMVIEVQRGNKPSTTFTRKGWRHIENGFYEKTNRRYSYCQLRNKFNQLRIRHQDFCQLLKQPGFILDPSCHKLTATDAVWKSHRKANKNMKRFRGKGCPMFNELRIIFEENRCLDAEGVGIEDGSSGATPYAAADNTSTCKDNNVSVKNTAEGNCESIRFSITNCVKCLESIERVDSNTYLKAIKMFKDADWREMFMAMSAQRRLDWLESLK